MDDMNNVSGMNSTGVDTSGISAETFGMPSQSMDAQQDSMATYASTWTGGGSYTVPGYNGIEPEPMKKEGRGLEIATLVFGILALVICCCNGFFGLIGLIIGIIAIAKGKRSGMSIAGLICSVIGLITAVGMLMFSMTDYGKELQDAFWEGFEEGYESTSGEDIDIGNDDEDYEESSVKTNEGTSVISNEEASKVTIDGNVITIPCTLGDVLQYYEVSSYNSDMMQNGLEPNAFELIYLAKDGMENGIYVSVTNDTDKAYDDIKDATVDSINIDNNGEAPVGSVNIFNDISLGMNSAQVEAAVKDITYNKSETNGYVFYNIYGGDKNQYSVSLMLSEDKVVNISIHCSSY